MGTSKSGVMQRGDLMQGAPATSLSLSSTSTSQWTSTMPKASPVCSTTATTPSSSSPAAAAREAHHSRQKAKGSQQPLYSACDSKGHRHMAGALPAAQAQHLSPATTAASASHSTQTHPSPSSSATATTATTATAASAAPPHQVHSSALSAQQNEDVNGDCVQRAVQAASSSSSSSLGANMDMEHDGVGSQGHVDGPRRDDHAGVGAGGGHNVPQGLFARALRHVAPFLLSLMAQDQLRSQHTTAATTTSGSNRHGPVSAVH